MAAVLSFDFFHTRPYLSLAIDSRDDIETTVLLLITGLIAGTVATSAQQARRRASAARSEIQGVHRIAEAVASGRPTDEVIQLPRGDRRAARLSAADLVDKRVADAAGTPVRLMPTEWDLLEVLVRHEGKSVSQRHLLQDVWGPGYGNETNYLRVQLAHLRAKLEPDRARPRYLITEPGMGYRFVGKQ